MMPHIVSSLFSLLLLPTLVFANIHVGVGCADITPPIGTPSAGYTEREGAGMEGIHDALLAIALFIDNGDKQIVLCSVDHLGFPYDLVQAIAQKIHAYPALATCDIFIASSHTHSGGGAYLNIPMLGESIAGTYSPDIAQFYIDQTVAAILQACHHPVAAKIGLGYGKTTALSHYRGLWPKNITPLDEVALIKVTDLAGNPLAVLFNYPLHPTVLPSHNRLFSSDFVGYTRKHLQKALGTHIYPLYFNGAQGDLIPVVSDDHDLFEVCDHLGKALAETVKKIWDDTETYDTLPLVVQKESYSFIPQETPFGLKLPIERYHSEMNLIIFNDTNAFITLPGELSCLYDMRWKKTGTHLGFTHVSIFGLTNDAHGYIILPESWQHKTFESQLSFGGEFYGDDIESRAEGLLRNQAPIYKNEEMSYIHQ